MQTTSRGGFLLSPGTIGAGATVITANARLSRQLRLDYDAQQQIAGSRLWESPDILPLEAWVRRCWQECVYLDPAHSPVLLDAAQEQVLWENAVADSRGEDVLLDAPATATGAAQAWELLHRWELPRDASLFYGLPDPEAFFGWMRRVEDRLLNNHWIAASQLPRVLTERIESGQLPLPGPFFIAGFDEVAPADRRLLNAVGALELPFLKDNRAVTCSRKGLENRAIETLHAASWARRVLEDESSSRIGIIVRDLAAQRAVVERIFDDALHPGTDFTNSDSTRAFHISAGMLLPDWPIIAAALLALELPRQMPLGEAGMLLRSPFLKLEAATGAAIDRELRREGVPDVSAHSRQVRRHFELLSDTFARIPLRQRPGQWSATFSQLLQAAGWPGSRTLSHTEYQTVERWDELLSQFSRLDLVIHELEYGEALTRLRRLAAGTRFAPQDTGAPIQIMDVLEAAGSHFDALWIAGLHDGAWPQPARPHPFLPLVAQYRAGLPHASPQRELEYVQKVTARLLESSPRVICSYPLHTADESLRVSPVIAHLQETGLLEDAELPPVYRGLAEAWFDARPLLDERAADSAPPVPWGTVQAGGVQVLQNQAACPFRAFAEHRLNARDLDVPVTGLSPSERGIVTHAALEAIWKELKTQEALLRLSPSERSELLNRAIREAMELKLAGRASGNLSQFRALEANRLNKLLAQWLDLEAARPAFEVLDLEVKIQIPVEGIELSVKADRVDHYLAGGHALIDYKTAKKVSVSDWEGERPSAPQLPLYATRPELEMASVLFASLVTGRPKLIGISEAGEDVGERKYGLPLQEQVIEWRQTMEALAASFRQGHAQVDPKNPKKSCEYCKLTLLCRVAGRESETT